MMRDAERLLSIDAELQRRVIGQDAVMATIGNALRKGAAGLRGQRPLGTFLFLGQTGVGKTETAKAIHDLLFPAGEMTRLDMSEYSEAHAVARLIGAPPGYLGHDEGGQLTEAVRLRPYQLVLLDEIEKAHPAVLLALLPLLDEGRMTDGRGRTVSFRNAVIVMTSNLGVAGAPEKARLGFGAEAETDTRTNRDEQERAQALQRARVAVPPELWNRIDEPLWFRSLDHTAVASIARSFIERLATIVRKEHGVELIAMPDAIERLVTVGHDVTLGARPMKRAVGRLIEAPIARAILAGEAPRGSRVTIALDADELTLRVEPGLFDLAIAAAE
jgi:ATP-dependent Clp protease ATP-binding subunit ClpC